MGDLVSTGLADGRMIVDFLNFTLPSVGGLELVTDLFGKFIPRPMGIKGYSHSASIVGQGVVGWSPDRQEQGVHVQLSSTALSNLQDVCPASRDVRGFLKYLLDMGAKVRRLDLAFDDREGGLSMGDIRECVKRKHLVSRFRKGSHIEGTLEGQGETFYFGSGASESKVRIYDKQAEQIDAGQEDPGHWVRVELQCRGDKAHAVALRYIAQGVPFVAGLLRGLIEFKIPGEDSNTSRWPIAPWWGAFLEQAEKAKIALPRERPTLERYKVWLDRQVAPSLAFITEAEGGSVDFVYQLLNSGASRLSPYHKALLDAAQRTSVGAV